MAKQFKEAQRRLFHNIYVCKVCKRKIRADPRDVQLGKVKCRKCGSRELRPKKKTLQKPGTE